MKIICSRNVMLAAINIVSKAVSSKSTMQILECIFIDCETNQVKFIANDMELGIETVVDGEIIEKGSIALEAKLFSDIIRKLPESDVILETGENEKIKIICENSRFLISGRSGEDFSVLPFVEKDNSICLSQFTLKEMIRQTIFSVSNTESNKMMTGELFEIENDQLKVVALDGHRLSIRKNSLKETYDHLKVIVPGKSLMEMNKILTGESEKEVKIYFTDKHIMFEFENTIVVSRLIEGEYFKINHMLSSDYETKLRVNRKDFMNCIDRSLLFVNEKEKKPIVFSITDHSMIIRIDSQMGSMNEEIAITKEGRDIVIGFNPHFFIDALRVIDEEEIEIYLVNSKAPCFIKDEMERYIYLILPVNINVV